MFVCGSVCDDLGNKAMASADGALNECHACIPAIVCVHTRAPHTNENQCIALIIKVSVADLLLMCVLQVR